MQKCAGMFLGLLIYPINQGQTQSQEQEELRSKAWLIDRMYIEKKLILFFCQLTKQSRNQKEQRK